MNKKLYRKKRDIARLERLEFGNMSIDTLTHKSDLFYLITYTIKCD